MPSPPKPWERGSTAGTGSAASSTATLAVPPVGAAAAPGAASSSLPSRPSSPLPSASSSSAAPGVPQRPATGFGTAGTSSFGATSTYNRPGGMYGSSSYGTGYGTGGYGSTYGTGGYGSTYGTGGYGSTYGSTYGGGYGSTYGSSYSSPYSSYGGYSSPYSRFGSSYSSYSSPYSRFGSGYGGYGSGYGGYGGGYGQGGYYANGVNDPNSLSRNMEQSTAAAFGVLENIVFAFQGLSDMLGSTFHATHSSFMAMVAVVEQFGNLRNMLGGFLGLFGLVRLVRDSIYWILGIDPPLRELTPDEFAEWERSGEQVLPDGTVPPGQAGQPRPQIARANRKPFILFFLFAVGIPWIFSKLVRFLQEQQMKKERRALEAAAARGDPQAKAILEGKDPATLGMVMGPDGRPMPVGQPGPGMGKLVFARAKHPFEPQNPQELALERGDIVAVLSKTDQATGQPAEWWRGRTRDGRIGFFPGSYVEELPDAQSPSANKPARPGSAGSERTALPSPGEPLPETRAPSAGGMNRPPSAMGAPKIETTEF